MRFPRQSHVFANMNRAHRGPRCLFPLITLHLRQVLCCIFNEMKKGAKVFISHLAFLQTAQTSARDDKLQFSEGSGKILTRASGKLLYQLLNYIYINQYDSTDSRKMKCFAAGSLVFWFEEIIKIFFILAGS